MHYIESAPNLPATAPQLQMAWKDAALWVCSQKYIIEQPMPLKQQTCLHLQTSKDALY